jgi:hypothetical protein
MITLKSQNHERPTPIYTVVDDFYQHWSLCGSEPVRDEEIQVGVFHHVYVDSWVNRLWAVCAA